MGLIVALGMTVVLSISVTTSVFYSSANSRSAGRSSADQKALSLAEAGLNNAVSVLNQAANALVQSPTLPSTEATASSQAYGNDNAYWWGVLVGTQWTLYGKGVVANPTGPGSATVVRKVSAKVQVTASLTQTLNAQAWNYIYSTKTNATGACDWSISNNVIIKAPVYVSGNLCVQNDAWIQKAGTPPSPEVMVNVVVQGKVTTSGSGYIGTSGAKVNSAYIGGGCNGHIPCKWNGGGDPVYANTVSATVPTISPPAADYDYWFANADPGPKHPCASSTGTVPVFDNQSVATATRNTSAGTINLTPAGTSAKSYTCTTASGGTLSWNAVTHVLTVAGAIFIDGNVTVGDGSLDQYNGQATIYVNGTLDFGSNQVCGGISGSSCDFTTWNPNTEMLIFVVNGTSGGTADTGINMGSHSMFQGGLYATHAFASNDDVYVDGPMVASTFNISNNITAKPFPTITTVPIGTPGNPNVHADPQPPTGFSG
jgi:Tfp pilus assembly protein PilX